MLYRLLSRLLDYPDEELYRNRTELRGLLDSPRHFRPEEGADIGGFLDWCDGLTLTEWQGQYVQTFDLNQDHSLHLTHHTFGDDRGRGPALIELDEHYKTGGFESNEKRELPDYLPMILEYVSTLEDVEAQWFLGQMKGVLALVTENLQRDRSPYAPLVGIIARHAQLIAPDAGPTNTNAGNSSP